MESMIYRIRFEDEEYFGDIGFYLKEIESPIRLEVGDKIALTFASFDWDGTGKDQDQDHATEMMDLLIKKSINPPKYAVTFEISDVIYNHDWYGDEEEFNFHGTIILKGK